MATPADPTITALRRRRCRTPASDGASPTSASPAPSRSLPTCPTRAASPPIVPATRSRKPLHLQHNSNPHDHPSAEPPQTLLKPFADSGDEVVLAAAFPRKARRAPKSTAAEEANGEEANGGAEDSETETEMVMEEQEEAGEEVVDVPRWLWRMGMGRYAAAFEAHEVDAEVLPWLTMNDLRDMGIGAVGSRRKLFCAIQRLTSQPPPRR